MADIEDMSVPHSKISKAYKTANDEKASIGDRLAAHAVLLDRGAPEIGTAIRQIRMAHALSDICRVLSRNEKEQRDKWIG